MFSRVRRRPFSALAPSQFATELRGLAAAPISSSVDALTARAVSAITLAPASTRTELVTATLALWCAHGFPSPHVCDSLGTRTRPLPAHSRARLLSGRKDLSRALQLAAEERVLRGAELGDAALTTPRAYLWAARGGAWRGGTGGLRPGISYADTTSADILKGEEGMNESARDAFAATTVREFCAVATLASDGGGGGAGSIGGSGGGGSGPGTAVPTASRSDRRIPLAALAPSTFHPLLDLPPLVTARAAAVAGLFREAADAVVHTNGIGSAEESGAGMAAWTLDAGALTAALEALGSSSGTANDARWLASVADWAGVARADIAAPLARTFVQRGAPSSAARAIAAAQAQLNSRDGAAGSADSSELERFAADAPIETRAALSAIKSAVADGHVSASVGLALARAATARFLAGGPALALALPSAASSPHRHLCEGGGNSASSGALDAAYSIAVEAASHARAPVATLMAFEILREARARPTARAAAAALDAAASLELPVDVYRLVGWAEAQRGFLSRDFAGGAGVAESVAAAQDPRFTLAALRAPPFVPTAAFRAMADAFAFVSTASTRSVPDIPRLPQDERAMMSARMDSKSDALAIAPLASSDGDAGGAYTVLAAALRALGQIGDAEYASLLFCRELGRLAFARARGDVHAALDGGVAAAAVEALAVAGDAAGALAAARAAIACGAPRDDVRVADAVLLVADCACTRAELSVAYGAMRLIGVAELVPTSERDRDKWIAHAHDVLLRLVLRLARSSVPVSPDEARVVAEHAAKVAARAAARAASRQDPFRVLANDGSSGSSVGELTEGAAGVDARVVWPLADENVARAVQDVLENDIGPGVQRERATDDNRVYRLEEDAGGVADEASAAPPAAAPLAVALDDGHDPVEDDDEDDSVRNGALIGLKSALDSTTPRHPLRVAAAAAEAIASSLVRWTVEFLASGGTLQGTTLTRENAATAVWDDGEDDDDGDALTAAREMVALALDSWPVSARLAAFRDASEFRRARIARKMERIEAKVAGAQRVASGADSDEDERVEDAAAAAPSRDALASALYAALAPSLSFSEFLGRVALDKNIEPLLLAAAAEAGDEDASAGALTRRASASRDDPDDDALSKLLGPSDFTQKLLSSATVAYNRDRQRRGEKAASEKRGEHTLAESWPALEDATASMVKAARARAVSARAGVATKGSRRMRVHDGRSTARDGVASLLELEMRLLKGGKRL